MNVSFHFSRVKNQKWDCRAKRYTFNFTRNCQTVFQTLYHFVFQQRVRDPAPLDTSSSTLGMVSLFYFSYSNRSGVGYHVDLICISLVTNLHFPSIFSWASWPFLYLLCWRVCSTLSTIFKLDCLFSYCEFWGSLCILNTSPFLDRWFINVFFQTMSCLHLTL